ncbi:hypothetical protein WJX81_000155 [Elliptochloris bilobata]|uniref:Peroxisomal ATPase PEX6 n=1 Tax=Elliptochloris bilobata TaxID=381761 RepID=A0AAW1REH5_9CHLO
MSVSDVHLAFQKAFRARAATDTAERPLGTHAVHQAPGWGRDTDSELAVTTATLHRLRLFHGSLVKVSNPERPEDGGERIVAALRRHFLEAPRLLAEGDTFAAVEEDASGRSDLLHALHAKTHSTASAFSGLGYFRVVGMQPLTSGSLLVDFKHTAVVLERQGSCCGALPAAAGRQPASEVGDNASAAWREPAELPRAGVLLPAWRRLAELLAPVLHPDAPRSGVRLAVMLLGPRGAGKATAARAAAAALGLHLVPFSCAELAAEGQIADALRIAFVVTRPYAPAVLLLRHLSAAAAGAAGLTGSQDLSAARIAAELSEGIADGMGRGSGPVLVVACAESAKDVPAPVRRCFTHELALQAPDEAQRLTLLQGALAASCADAAALADAASQTAGLLPRDLRAIAADAAAAAVHPLLPWRAPGAQVGAGSAAVTAEEGVAVGKAEVDAALEAARSRMSAAIGAAQVPDVRWEDVGGLEDVKAAILETVELPLRHPHLFASGLRRRSGMLLYGPPGTGKTLLAKAVATECALNFISVKGPELINMYIGESERQVREVFERAHRARPCVLFFDELDSLAPARGAGADSGGVMDRVVSQLLAQIDGLQTGQDVFIIGATNRPDLLDMALLRPGRLDRLLFVGVAEDVCSKVKVLHALTRKFALAADVDLGAVAAECAPTFTGADLYALAADAWTAALYRSAAEVC